MTNSAYQVLLSAQTIRLVNNEGATINGEIGLSRNLELLKISIIS
jgi:hypothetical protein